MVVVLLFTLRTVDREVDQWRARGISGTKSTDEVAGPAISFFPFEHSPVVQEVLTLQWPALIAASTIAPVPLPSNYNRNPAPLPLTMASYRSLIVTVAGYWYLIGLWIDVRLLGVPPLRRHSGIVRFILSVAAACAVPFFPLFLGKDIFAGWPHGSKGAYGITVWLALACLMLLTELGVFRRST